MPRKKKDLTNQIFGELTAISYDHKVKNQRFWFCRCSCGGTAIKRQNSLLNSVHPNCGNCDYVPIDHSDQLILRGNRQLMKTYAVWTHIKQRCFNPNSRSFAAHQNLDPKMPDNWKKSFRAFLGDMGEKPAGDNVLGRIDMSLGYSKGNCMWATRADLVDIHNLLR